MTDLGGDLFEAAREALRLEMLEEAEHRHADHEFAKGVQRALTDPLAQAKIWGIPVTVSPFVKSDKVIVLAGQAMVSQHLFDVLDGGASWWRRFRKRHGTAVGSWTPDDPRRIL